MKVDEEKGTTVLSAGTEKRKRSKKKREVEELVAKKVKFDEEKENQSKATEVYDYKLFVLCWGVPPILRFF